MRSRDNAITETVLSASPWKALQAAFRSPFRVPFSDDAGSAADYAGSKEARAGVDYIPNSRPAHRLPCNIDSSLINRKFANQPVDDFECQRRDPSPRPGTTFGPRYAVLLREIVFGPSTIESAEQQRNREIVFDSLRQQPHARSENIKPSPICFKLSSPRPPLPLRYRTTGSLPLVAGRYSTGKASSNRSCAYAPRTCLVSSSDLFRKSAISATLSAEFGVPGASAGVASAVCRESASASNRKRLVRQAQAATMPANRKFAAPSRRVDLRIVKSELRLLRETHSSLIARRSLPAPVCYELFRFGDGANAMLPRIAPIAVQRNCQIAAVNEHVLEGSTLEKRDDSHPHRNPAQSPPEIPAVAPHASVVFGSLRNIARFTAITRLSTNPITNTPGPAPGSSDKNPFASFHAPPSKAGGESPESADKKCGYDCSHQDRPEIQKVWKPHRFASCNCINPVLKGHGFSRAVKAT